MGGDLFDRGEVRLFVRDGVFATTPDQAFLVDMGAAASYFDVVRDGEAYTQDPALIAEVMIRCDDQLDPSLPTDGLLIGLYDDFGVETYYGRTRGID